MGLDQFAFFRSKKEMEALNKIGEIPEEWRRPEDMYFRKNRHLEGYMANIWHKRGNTGEFNCEDLILTREDIEGLTKDNLDDNSYGFFWGEHSLEDDWKEIAKFKKRALDAIDSGCTVVYSSWW